jgi:hypothetical protein
LPMIASMLIGLNAAHHGPRAPANTFIRTPYMNPLYIFFSYW